MPMVATPMTTPFFVGNQFVVIAMPTFSAKALISVTISTKAMK